MRGSGGAGGDIWCGPPQCPLFGFVLGRMRLTRSLVSTGGERAFPLGCKILEVASDEKGRIPRCAGSDFCDL